MASIPMPGDVDECDAARDHRAANEALYDGMQSGRQGQSFSLNPHPLGSEEHAEWSRGWHSGDSQRASAELRLRARRCSYTDRPCDCEGRGLCLDVA